MSLKYCKCRKINKNITYVKYTLNNKRHISFPSCCVWDLSHYTASASLWLSRGNNVKHFGINQIPKIFLIGWIDFILSDLLWAITWQTWSWMCLQALIHERNIRQTVCKQTRFWKYSIKSFTPAWASNYQKTCLLLHIKHDCASSGSWFAFKAVFYDFSTSLIMCPNDMRVKKDDDKMFISRL